MEISFDPNKNVRNIEERNLPFPLVAERLHIVCYTHVNTGIRVISFRKANDREVKAYEE